MSTDPTACTSKANATHLLPLASMQPQSYGLRTDYTKARLAYGHWGIPQLCQQLSATADRTPAERQQSLATLADELYDPEKCYRAICKHRIVECLTLLLAAEHAALKDKSAAESSLLTIERVLNVLLVVGQHMVGALAIATGDGNGIGGASISAVSGENSIGQTSDDADGCCQLVGLLLDTVSMDDGETATADSDRGAGVSSKAAVVLARVTDFPMGATFAIS